MQEGMIMCQRGVGEKGKFDKSCDKICTHSYIYAHAYSSDNTGNVTTDKPTTRQLLC